MDRVKTISKEIRRQILEGRLRLLNEARIGAGEPAFQAEVESIQKQISDLEKESPVVVARAASTGRRRKK